MPERFTYPEELTRELQQQKRRRFWLWLVVATPFWAVGLRSILSGDGSFGLICAVVASGMFVFFEFLLRRIAARTEQLSLHTLEYDGRFLRQIATDGTVLGEIDLSTAFSVTYPYSAAGNAVYRVLQDADSGSRRFIEFGPKICRAERLVREVLRHSEWPPGADSP